MTKAISSETSSRANKAYGEALLIAAGHERALRAVLIKAWIAVTSQHFFHAKPAGVPEHPYRAFGDPPALRNCVRCSKLECSTS
jgi:hypothetical protein